jgi:hypothetical protein
MIYKKLNNELKDDSLELREHEFGGYYWTAKIKPEEEICFVKDIQRLNLLFFTILLFQLLTPASQANVEPPPIRKEMIKEFREENFSNLRYTMLEAEKILQDFQKPIFEKIEVELSDSLRSYLIKNYTSKMIDHHILQDFLKAKVLSEAQKNIEDNERNIKSLILIASSQLDPKYPVLGGNLPSSLTVKNSMRADDVRQRFINLEKVVMLQEQELKKIRESHETLVACIKILSYLVTIFQIGKVTFLIFVSPSGREKVRKLKGFILKKGKKVYVALMEKESP